jgi:hypothetical protein
VPLDHVAGRRSTVFELKHLTAEGIPGAFAKAERYRLLNEPWEAESIYLDVLQVEPDNQAALVGLLLTLTDQFSHDGAAGFAQAREVLPRIRDDYERAYYAGIICERRAKTLLDGAKLNASSMAHTLLREAKRWYEQAEQLRPPGNDDVLLRWNACARLVLRFPHVATASTAPEERYEPYSDLS